MLKNTVTQDGIDSIISRSAVETHISFGKCLVVSVQLPNGFILTESSACVDPANFDEEIGMAICMEKIQNRLWELEGYLLQDLLYQGKGDGIYDVNGH